MKYAAFISYRHGEIDEKVAMQIQKEIERYRIPKRIAKNYKKRTLGKVFRDADDLRAASNLSEIIRQGLDESEYLIVICTKRYQESVWCMEEIEYFIETRGRENIIVVLVEGEPQESFPKLLTEYEENGQIINIEPLAVDVRAESEKATVKLVAREKLRFISRMLNLDYDDLKQRQKERLRRRIMVFASLVIICLSIFVGVVARKNIQLNTAYEKLDDSMQQTLKGQSYYLAEYANEAYLNGDRTTAVLLALMALPEDLENPDRPYVPSVMRALTDALGVYDFSNGYQANEVFGFEKEAYDTKVEISQDGNFILIERYYSAAANMLEGEVEIYRLDTRQLIRSFELTDIRNSSEIESFRCARMLSDSKTLVFLGKDGLQAVNIYSNEVLFTGERGNQMVVSEKNDVISVFNSEEGILYHYNVDGTKRAETKIGTKIRCNLYCISPDSTIAVLSLDSKESIGFLIADTSSDFIWPYSIEESCSQISFINEYTLCFIRQDPQIGKSHIVLYDLNLNAANYLVDLDKALDSIAVSGYESCFYYDKKTLYEVDGVSGKVIWKKEFPSDVISMKTQGDYLAVTLASGQSYFYNSKKKELINTAAGNGQSFYMLEFTEDYAIMSDFWGQNIRVYSQKQNQRKDVIAKNISSVNASAPEKWMTADSTGDNFLIDFKNGMVDKVQIFSAEDLSILGGTTLGEMDYESFANLAVEAAGSAYISVQDYAYGENAHFDAKTMEKSFSFSDDSYYFYSDDKSRITIAEEDTLVLYDAASGKKLKEVAIKAGYDRGLLAENYQIFGNDTSIYVVQEKEEELILENAVLSTFHEKSKTLYYRNEDATKWYVYSLEENKIVCSGDSGSFEGTMLFDDGNYVLNDYSAVYDTKTWKKVLDLSEISTGVYGVSTRENLPYFVVWYQSGDTETSGKTTGSNVAYLYSKDGSGEIVGVVPNYVTTARDGRVIIYDGEHTLYKVPLYSTSEIIEKAKAYVRGISLTENQKEKYHIYSE